VTYAISAGQRLARPDRLARAGSTATCENIGFVELSANVACTVCGCVSDDLQITVAHGRISKCQGACHLAEPWFLGQDNDRPPVALIEGQAVPLEAAVRRAADLLRTASSPLIYGLSRSSTEGQRAAVALGERIGATIDTTASLCHAPSVMATQEVGESTCTLGEVKNRADLVIFWGSNPVESHPATSSAEAVVSTTLGGRGGASALTDFGADVIRRYRSMESATSGPTAKGPGRP
jgi:formylmethanofuran dehydrogenase subunit B